MGEQIVLRKEFRGPIREIFSFRGPEGVLDGPAGTGKSVGIWEKTHACLTKYPRARALALRKTLTSLTTSGLVTFERHILHPAEGVEWFGGSSREPASFRYPNGSRLVVGGLDRPTKVLSSEYDIIYIQELTEATEEEWELCSTRLRNGAMPYQQMLGDCNPDAPSHWIKQRAARGKLTLLSTRHEHNPHYFDREGNVTEAGRVYIERLDNLTGVRHKRYRLGLWVAAEGQVYEDWDPVKHRIKPADLPSDWASWPRFWDVDFGFTNPFVWHEWAQDGDGRLFRLREIYKTQTLVEDHAKEIRKITGMGTPAFVRPRVLVCDHDAEDRATLERHLGITTTAAYKGVSPGIQAQATRLRDAGDGRPRMFFVDDGERDGFRFGLMELDQSLIDKKHPTRTEEEFESYVWDTSAGRKKGEEPKKEFDHGQDASRYMVAHIDKIGSNYSWDSY